ncbi:MAG TPA: glycosyltransferase family 39 protein, partial [Vicinamibacteria bacterium]|nr:glycosyltransferase family 39 protein [Vicinamibacteria bacterium]
MGPPTAAAEPAVRWGGTFWPLQRLPKTLVTDPLPTPHLLRRILWASLLGLAFLVAALLDWTIMGSLLRAAHTRLERTEALRYDALLRLPVLVFLGLLFLLKYDARLDPGFPFQLKWIFVAIGLIFLMRVALWVALVTGSGSEAPALEETTKAHAPRVRHVVILVCLAVLLVSGTVLRVHKARFKSLDHDEISMVLAAEAIWAHGYPLREIGPVYKPLTTYEILPYPIALSMGLFGPTPFAARLPAVIFAGLTILLIYHVGTRIWGPLTGLLAAAIYTFSPFSIYWGSDAFHPQQAQFFALLASYQFYRALGGPTPAHFKVRPIYWTALAFAVCYLSWEGTGLLLPALFLCLLVQYGADFRWLKNGHL